MKDSQLKALLKKTAAKAEQNKPKDRKSFDTTLDATRRANEQAGEANDLFKEMKRREF